MNLNIVEMITLIQPQLSPSHNAILHHEWHGRMKNYEIDCQEVMDSHTAAAALTLVTGALVTGVLATVTLATGTII